MKVSDLKNHPLYYKNNETVLYQTYIKTVDGSLLENNDVTNNQNDIAYYHTLFSKNLTNYIKNKTIVDAGSGIGRNLPMLSAFNPKKIISVEMDQTFIEEQKKFSRCIFPFLKERKISENLDFYNESMETFVDRKLDHDTIFFFECWHLMNFDFIFNNTTADLVICTKPTITHNVYDALKNSNYKVKKKIPIEQNNVKNYFFLIAEKT